ncbi:MAG: hypothetical protein LIQ30_12910 [Planctomycetes bacterium]|nr:hypothetical protein [Planctomycetota bacterium]MCD7896369.1 hypothetical protein [Planctomycetaceae bacterium]
MAQATITPEPTGAEAPQTQTAPEQNPASTAAPTGERPAWLPEGFDTPEALAAAYAEMTKKTSGETDKPDQTDPQSTDKPAAATDESVAEFVQDTGLDPAALSQEIATTGDINGEAKTALAQKLEKAGLPPSMIDEYISGQKAVMEATVRDIKAVAGGEEGYNQMAEWARENLSEAEIQAFSNIMLNADVNTAKLTVGNLYARYKGSAAIPGSRVRGSTGTGGGDVFHSIQQQVDAQSDPRYAKDPAFRRAVEEKIARTLKAGGYSHSNR